MSSELILPLDSSAADLQNAGGKGANMARLIQAGFAVPPGFILTTMAYRTFVSAHNLGAWILDLLQGVDPEDPPALNTASQAIRERFSKSEFPGETAIEIRAAYVEMGGSPVAVRSSATAEDLPGMSFAGQQDTYLNILGEEALLKAILDCWSSLWTARAIGYRSRNRISQAEVSVAVIVQRMVPAQVSGVLFTANPLSGTRYETVIDATLGLGEALVSGLVEPDHYQVDVCQKKIMTKALGTKNILIRGKEEGGVEKVEVDSGRRQALSDDQILALAELGQKVSAEFDFPQDIEWAWVDGAFYLLQSRPITSLYPLPEGVDRTSLHVFFSFGAVQGMLEPMTPLGRDAIRLLFAGAASLFGYQVTHNTQGVIRGAGERLWVEVTTLLRSRFGRKLTLQAMTFVEPGTGKTLESILPESGLQPDRDRPGLGTLRRIVPFAWSLLGRVIRLWRDPDRQRDQLLAEAENAIVAIQEDLADLRNQRAGGDDLGKRLSLCVAMYRRLYDVFPFAILNFVPGIAASMALLNLLSRLAPRRSGSGQGFSPLILEITRGAPHNVTTEMDLALWQTARVIQKDAPSLRRFQEAGPQALAASYLEDSLPPTSQKAIGKFLDRYGVRGVGEIDIGRPRWREDPTQVMQVLTSYLSITDESQAPDAVFARGDAKARAAIEELVRAVRSSPGGRLKARLVRWAAYRVRALIGMRESPKFFIVRVMGLIRQGLLELGEDLVAAGYLANADDLFFFSLDELDNLPGERLEDWPAQWAPRIAGRRAAYQRECLRKQVPRLLLSDGRAFYEGLSAPADLAVGGDVITGSPVSPGQIEGVVRVVLEPHNTRLAPGEILVCPGTDPAWTPLFLAAGGLVMEVGGMMTHGSVVAREYGIPAVVGVHQATTRLKTGQRVYVNGTSGEITLLK